MYLPPHFEETRPELIRDLIAAHPFGTLVTFGSDGINANHIPFLLENRTGDDDALIGHVARNNDVWHNRDADIEALVIFQGPSAYISPNWYPAKAETHEAVPTYNYAVAHVYGDLVVHDDRRWVRGAVGKLTKAMEASQPRPWRMAEAPAAYLDCQLQNIVGIEIPIARAHGKWKVSQNRAIDDRLGAVEGLRACDEAEAEAVAQLILSRLPS